MATGQDIADEARSDLNDSDASNLRWSDAEMLRFINAAQRQIVILVPEANVVVESGSLVEGSRQTIPSGGVKFIDLFNVVVDEEYHGNPAVTIVEKDALDSSYPSWLQDFLAPSAEEDGVVVHVTHDPRDPKTFNVYPRVVSGAEPDVDIKFSKLPTALASLASTFGLGDEYINAAVEYVKYRMLSKDGRYGGIGSEGRQELWNTFLRTLGFKVTAEKRIDSATARPPVDDHG